MTRYIIHTERSKPTSSAEWYINMENLVRITKRNLYSNLIITKGCIRPIKNSIVNEAPSNAFPMKLKQESSLIQDVNSMEIPFVCLANCSIQK